MLRAGCAFVLMTLLAPGAWAEGATRTSETLALVDVDGTKISFSYDDLRRLPQEIEEECICAGHSSGFLGIFDYSGVRLSQILDKAKAANGAGDYKRENLYVLFKGTDGYQVLASWTELTLTSDGLRILIATEKNAQALPPSEGKFRLVLPGDKWVGRSVRCLETIEIHCAEGVVEKHKDEKKP